MVDRAYFVISILLELSLDLFYFCNLQGVLSKLYLLWSCIALRAGQSGSFPECRNLQVSLITYRCFNLVPFEP